uniref:Uncharacterized protein n=1 Tax=Spongospora subterranea TaxID=70186 RepID=A0A0H5R4J5_9EUKA|eukprot:CRZ08752.1 hypothetical protein [Spongospora subterranea]
MSIFLLRPVHKLMCVAITFLVVCVFVGAYNPEATKEYENAELPYSSDWTVEIQGPAPSPQAFSSPTNPDNEEHPCVRVPPDDSPPKDADDPIVIIGGPPTNDP